MYGAFAGDIAGSIYEFHNIKTKDFPLFQEQCYLTDDSYMTMAVASACLDYDGDLDAFRTNLVSEMRRLGARYPYGGYGGYFFAWLKGEKEGPYGSCGNGSAMRVSPCGWACDTLEETLALAGASADVTHNHPEGIKGAQATAAAIFLARTGHSKEEIRTYITDTFGYDLSRTCDDIRPAYTWGALCQDTVPEAIISFLDATDFEDTIRNAISLGGDSDTLAAIAGSIAEAYYGIPAGVLQRVNLGLLFEVHEQELAIVFDFASRFVLENKKKGETKMTYDREAWLEEVVARNKTKPPEERAARLAELKAKLEAGTATDQDKDEIVSMPR